MTTKLMQEKTYKITTFFRPVFSARTIGPPQVLDIQRLKNRHAILKQLTINDLCNNLLFGRGPKKLAKIINFFLA